MRCSVLWPIALACLAGSCRPDCAPASCNGCCDSSGVCQPGVATSACGAAGARCSACSGSQACTAGACGQGDGGGTGGGGGGAGGGGACAGCLGSQGECVELMTAEQCGPRGASCAACASNEVCTRGVCGACTGCLDPSTETCAEGTAISACGSSGTICQTCSSICVDHECVNDCSALTCPTGCCDGTRCVEASGYSDALCGVGVGGARCVSCSSAGVSCDLDAGACDLSADAGPPLCSQTQPCSAGCCVVELGVCFTPGAIVGALTACGASTDRCELCQTACTPDGLTCG